MRKIINGKRYDTETAEYLGRDETEGIGENNFHYYCEELYRTSKGNYFLYGEGHGLTRWATRNADGMRGWGSGIESLSKEEALSWAQRSNMSAREIEAEFGDCIEDA